MKKEIDELVNADAEEKAETQTAVTEDGKVTKIEKEMGELKSDVKKISDDLKRVVTELQKSIVEVRAAVSEIENPFNLLRAVSSERDVRKLNNERSSVLKPGIETLIIGKPEKKEKDTEIFHEERLEEKISALQDEGKATQTVEKEIVMHPHPVHLQKFGLNYLDWVWSLIETGLTSDDILQLAKSYEFMGYLPENSSGHMYSLAVAAERAMTKGFGKKRLLVNMYKAATISGVQISLEDILELISIAERRMKHRISNGPRRNGISQKNGSSQRNGSLQRDV